MKKWLIIFSLVILPGLAIAQEEDVQQEEASKIHVRMKEYIQNKLGLTKNEAERFTPIFFRYLREFALTHREFKPDRLVLQQKIIELRLRYRNEFREILDEKRANRVYKLEDEFRQEAIRMLKENRRQRPPLRRSR